MEHKEFPLCGFGAGKKIPWSCAERAYEKYVRKYGKGQTLERLAERGGFYPEEMDELYPAWREDTEEIYLLRRAMDSVRDAKEDCYQDIISHMHINETGMLAFEYRVYKRFYEKIADIINLDRQNDQ